MTADDSAKDYTLAHVMLIYDEPLLSGQPPLTGHLPVSRGQNRFNPFAPGDFAEKRVLKLIEWFSGHCRAIKS